MHATGRHINHVDEWVDKHVRMKDLWARKQNAHGGQGYIIQGTHFRIPPSHSYLHGVFLEKFLNM